MNRSPEDWAAENLVDIPLDEPTSRESSGATPDESDIPADTMKVIREGAPYNSRVSPFFNCVLVLHRLDFTVDAAKINRRWCGDTTYIATLRAAKPGYRDRHRLPPGGREPQATDARVPAGNRRLQ